MDFFFDDTEQEINNVEENIDNLIEKEQNEQGNQDQEFLQNDNEIIESEYNDNTEFDNSYDETCPRKITISAKEQDEGYIFVGVGSIYIAQVKRVFELGKLRFKNQQCKAIAFQMMRYNLYE